MHSFPDIIGAKLDSLHEASKNKMTEKMEKLSLRTLGAAGIMIFLPLFLFTFTDPYLVERAGQSFISWKLKEGVNEKIDSFNLPEPTKLESLFGTKVKELRSQTEKELEKVKRRLKADAPGILAEQISRLRNLDCDCRNKWEKSIRSSMESKLLSLEVAKSALINFSHIKYMEIVHKLTRDVRIFLGTNAAVFLLLLLASFVQPRAMKHLFLPSFLLLTSTVICSYFYIFEQNWLYTIIYNDYTGIAYIGYLSIVFAILCDILFNRARVTTEVINGCLQAIGHAANLTPC
ncbi:hypothetical protein [Bacterioplanoides sp. SCSIO 12839]|uniref:hypothetical protein n=1 Tax=Bacterioplanoides sp. SCSIO 12839 TaxID=2829569 RepID=UPI0021068C0F|nr:hypothetical protein [Bacterioplanoides sp. SCSIO 12839]UTW47221.1 hypothetical protein KFF03_11565 [Bacterioplanoides sp. SCSIO 12839]